MAMSISNISNEKTKHAEPSSNQDESTWFKLLRKTITIVVLLWAMTYFIPFLSVSGFFQYCSMGFMAMSLTFGLSQDNKKAPLSKATYDDNGDLKSQFPLGIKHPVSLFLLLGLISCLCSLAANEVYTTASIWALPAVLLLGTSVVSSFYILYLSCRYFMHIVSDFDNPSGLEDQIISGIAFSTIVYEFSTILMHFLAIYFTGLTGIHAAMTKDIVFYALKFVEVICFSSRAYDNLSADSIWSSMKEIYQDIMNVLPINTIKEAMYKSNTEITSEPSNKNAVDTLNSAGILAGNFAGQVINQQSALSDKPHAIEDGDGHSRVKRLDN
ncbi:MAG TPA: hypothetical protein QF353_05845 [Gammaproteobacteria bacterium]|nr:hypothetical protein [Gammaproteobacteria bacterium]